MSPLEINVKTANFVLIYNKSDGKCPLIAHFFPKPKEDLKVNTTFNIKQIP